MQAILQDTSMPSCTHAHTHTDTHTHTHTHTRWPATEECVQADLCRHNRPQGGPRYHPGPHKGLGVLGHRTFQQQPVSSVEAVLLAHSDTRDGRKDQFPLTAPGLLWKAGL